MKLPAHRVGLPGKVISFYIVPLYPAYPALARRGTFRSRLNTVDPFGGAKRRFLRQAQDTDSIEVQGQPWTSRPRFGESKG